MPPRFPDFPLADADKCVKCALCLPHCPTYRETLDESESPRGRIALMQGFASGALALSPRLAAHLDRCLACRACEAVCPAEVPYGKLIDAARLALSQAGHSEPWRTRLFAHLVRGRRTRAWLQRLLRAAQALKLTAMARVLGLSRAAALLPRLGPVPVWREEYLPAGPPAGEVMLFLGCVAQMVEPGVSAAAITVLSALGYRVRIPAAQVCCGALDLHAGRRALAKRLAEQNLIAFAAPQNPNVPVLSTASGCGATLAEYAGLGSERDPAAFQSRVQDISAFLAGTPRIGALDLRPWSARVLVHHPCTLRNVLRADKAVVQLLRRIPQLQVESVPAETGCCGAAGSYLLNEPEMADRLAARIAEALAARRPDAVASSNVGCALHLRAALQRRGLTIPLLHPVEILAQQLPSPPAAL